MASNFAFQPFGLSQAVTVGGASPQTVSFSVVAVGSTTTLTLSGGSAFVPSSIRISNLGTEAVFVNFAPSLAGASASPSNAMPILANSVENFSIHGYRAMALACASTFTVTVNYTLGEGL